MHEIGPYGPHPLPVHGTPGSHHRKHTRTSATQQSRDRVRPTSGNFALKLSGSQAKSGHDRNLGASLDYSADSLARDPGAPLELPTLPQAQAAPAHQQAQLNNSWFSPAKTADGSVFYQSFKVGEFMDADEFEFTSQAQILVEKLRKIKDEMQEAHGAGNNEAREIALIDFVNAANDETLELNLESAREQRSARRILEMAVQIIDDCRKYSDGTNLYSYLYYDTFNNLARVSNRAGDIQASLDYLLQALEHTKYLGALGKEKAEDLIQSTMLPELYLNISRAQLELDRHAEALRSARQAAEQSQVRASLLAQRLKDPAVEIEEKQRLAELMRSHLNLQIHSVQARGEILQHGKKYQEALAEYNFAKSLIAQSHPTHHRLYKQIVHKINSVHADIKQGHLKEFDDQLAELEQQRRRFEEPKRPVKVEVAEVQSEKQPLTLEALALADKTLENRSVLQGYDGRKDADEEIVSIDQVRHAANTVEVNDAS